MIVAVHRYDDEEQILRKDAEIGDDLVTCAPLPTMMDGPRLRIDANCGPAP